MLIIWYLLGLIGGVATPVQASYNNKTREELRSLYLAALLNFITAGILLAVIVLGMEHNLSVPLREIARQPLWIWLGGVCGIIIQMLNVICLPKLGSAGNIMIVCCGQIFAGLAIDQWGLFGSPLIPMTWLRLAGAVLVLLGIAVVNGIRIGKKDDLGAGAGMGGANLRYVILATICGFACAVQVAVNGTLKVYAGSALKATLISMSVGFTAIVLLILAVKLVKGRNGIYEEHIRPEHMRLRPYMLAGGVLASIVVGGNALIAPILGTGIVTMLNLIGMIGAGLAIDAAGFLGIDKKPVTAAKIAGMVLMLAGTAMISLM
jgi:transporter family-2 protein